MDLDRRQFLQKAGAQAGLVLAGARALEAAVGPTDAVPAGPSFVQSASDVVVIGAGAFGVWTALSLREQGASVTLVDQYGPGNSRATSGAEVRQIRAAGRDELDTRWSLKALETWRSRLQEWGRPELLIETSLLRLSVRWNEAERTAKAWLDRYKVPTEVVDRDELARRYPQMGLEGIEFALIEPAGMLKSRQCCQVVARALERQGGRVVIGRVEPGRRSGGRLLDVVLTPGGNVGADTFVFACGPWFRKLFPDVMGNRLRTPPGGRCFFGTPPGDNRFMHPAFPNYRDNTTGFYGYPALSQDYRGFNVIGGGGGGSGSADPDSVDRMMAPEALKRARDFVALRFPALKDQPLLETQLCVFDTTATGQFIIDRHPELENVWIVGGGTGRGVKHSPSVGDYAAHRIVGQDQEPELTSLFQLGDTTFE
ncbi:MAG: FAD-binding oxidoreductase [Gemmatimonadetes bacterium]|nr:FAD-binding oxidoreductase [Gemmatimonadota bacterium]